MPHAQVPSRHAAQKNFCPRVVFVCSYDYVIRFDLLTLNSLKTALKAFWKLTNNSIIQIKLSKGAGHRVRVQKIVNTSPSRNVLISPLEDPLNVISTFNEAVTVTEICNNKRVVLALFFLHF